MKKYCRFGPGAVDRYGDGLIVLLFSILSKPPGAVSGSRGLYDGDAKKKVAPPVGSLVAPPSMRLATSHALTQRFASVPRSRWGVAVRFQLGWLPLGPPPSNMNWN